MGAGAIGCYVGGALAATGQDVVLVGRDALGAELRAHGLTVIEMDRTRRTVGPDRFKFATEASALADCDVVLCAVKSGQTEETGRTLAAVLRRDAVVVSLQNGVRNADVLRRGLAVTGCLVLGAIVGFNVVWRDGGVFQRATTGPLVIEASGRARATDLVRLLASSGLPVERPRDLAAQQWSKLLMNLNNAVSALSGAPTRDLILVAGYRRVVAAVIDEALGVLRAAGITPARLGPLPPQIFPTMLRLPTPLVKVLAGAQLKIDPEARSSMWQDLDKRRRTEVDFLNGEIVALAKQYGASAPINERIVAMVHEVEARGQGSPDLSPDALWSALHDQPARVLRADELSP